MISKKRFFRLVLLIFVFFILSVQHSCSSYHFAELPDWFLPQRPLLPLPEAELNPQLVSAFLDHYEQYASSIKNPIVTLIDFSLPSTAKRLWTIHMQTGEVLFHSLVAHGQNTGYDEANSFSNRINSHQSSLGFFLTGPSYQGKHGLSMRLHGLENGINDKAMERAIVVHGADYVSDSFIHANGRLGRSHGCPAIPDNLVDPFIQSTKHGSLLFIYHPSYTTEIMQLASAK